MKQKEIKKGSFADGWDNGYNAGYTDGAAGVCRRTDKDRMKTSEKLQCVLCDPDGKISMVGSAEDIRIAQEVLEEVKLLEKYLDSLKQIVNSENQVIVNIQEVKDEKVREQILFAWNVFEDFPKY